ncbi:hypothetical protein T06_16498 [Trichinella sp. T6]|nr:hypothetical protein T06_16498 [Trichinella sp. T6]
MEKGLFSYFIWTFSTPTPTRVDNKRAENGHSCPPPADPIVSIQRHLRDDVAVSAQVEISSRPMVSGIATSDKPPVDPNEPRRSWSGIIS